MGLKETHDLIEHLGRKIKKVDVGQKCGCVFGNKEKWEKKEGNKSKWSSNHPPAISFPHTNLWVCTKLLSFDFLFLDENGREFEQFGNLIGLGSSLKYIRNIFH